MVELLKTIVIDEAVIAILPIVAGFFYYLATSTTVCYNAERDQGFKASIEVTSNYEDILKGKTKPVDVTIDAIGLPRTPSTTVIIEFP
ncbi:MAG: hypothetical protein QW775_04090 [Ignisphaera sp.]|uniref:Uncharacterized protein n=1 Tax=Ignisphaera aggregans TaxID=334771 RepID=A0A7C4JIX2_9CREN